MALGAKTGGRKKGTQNKFTVSVKEAFKAAFDEMQESPETALATWAKTNQTEFFKLASKMIPAEVNANITAQESALDLLARGTKGKADA